MIELRSRTDDLVTLRPKMQEYASNGVSLGVMINPQDKQVEIYRPNQANEIFENPASIDCAEVLPGFVINLAKIL